MDVRIDNLKKTFQYLFDGDRRWRKNQKEDSGFYVGGDYQWDQQDLSRLDDENRPHITHNIIQHKVNTLYGFEKNNRTGWRAHGIGNEDDAISQNVTGVLKFENRNERFNKVMSRVFKDMVIGGRGICDLSVVRGEDFLWENRLRRENPAVCYRDPQGREPDMSDWVHVGRSKWYTVNTLKMMFPTKMKDIGSLEDIAWGMNQDNITESPDLSLTNNDYPVRDNFGEFGVLDPDFYDKEFSRVRVGELWEAEEKEVAYLINNMDEERIRIGFDKKKINEFEGRVQQLNDLGMDKKFKIQSKPERIIFHDLFAGNVHFVEHEPSEFTHGEFPLQFGIAYLEEVGNKVENYGIVRNLLDPQREKNKYHSLSVDILSRSPKGGGMFKTNLKNATAIKNFSSTGGWHAVSDPNDFKEFSSNFVPALNAAVALEQNSKQETDDISGINPNMMGFQQSAKESGVLSRQRIKMGTMGIEELFDNHNTLKNRVLKMMVKNVQQFWTLEKLIKTVGGIPNLDPQMQVMAADKFLKNNSTVKYDIEIDEGENSPSVRAANFAEMIQAVQFGIPIPPDAIVDTSTWANKSVLKQGVQQQQIAQLMQQQGKQNGK